MVRITPIKVACQLEHYFVVHFSFLGLEGEILDKAGHGCILLALFRQVEKLDGHLNFAGLQTIVMFVDILLILINRLCFVNRDSVL